MNLKNLFASCMTKTQSAISSILTRHETELQQTEEVPVQVQDTNKTEPVKPEKKESMEELYRLIPNMRNVDTDALFEDTCEGDILFAVVPVEAEKLAAMKPNSRRRPYLIVKKTEDGVFAYGCALRWNGNEKELTFEPASENSNLKEGTRILLNKSYFIPKTHLSNYLDHLSASDQMRINAILNMCAKSSKTHPRFNSSLKIQANSVIFKGEEHYYICSLEENHALVFPMNMNRKGVPVNFNGMLRYVDVVHGRMIDIDDTCSCAGALTKSARNDILRACRLSMTKETGVYAAV